MEETIENGKASDISKREKGKTTTAMSVSSSVRDERVINAFGSKLEVGRW